MHTGRWAVVAGIWLCLLAVPACGAAGGAVGGAGIQGRVQLRAGCPNARQASPCPDRPVAVEIEFLDGSGNVVTRLRSDASGYFKADLMPGTYAVEPLPPGLASNGAPNGSASTVSVKPGGYTWVLLTVYSGVS